MEFENPKLFIRGLPVNTDEETLRQHFSEYGEVKHALVIPGKDIGFVTFSDPLMAKNALQEEHIILDTQVDVEPAKPRTQIGNRKIFVGGLPSNITLEEFKEYFGSYGTITDAVVIYDKESHRFRGFGFVTYDSEEAAMNVLQNKFHELNNKMVEVKRAEPKEKMSGNCDSHDYGPDAVQRNVIDAFNTQPVYNPACVPGWKGYAGCFMVPVADRWEPSFGSYNQVYYHANSNSWWENMYVPGQEWKAT